ncbi:MAG: N-acetylneuraminate synthase family protein [Pirellulales bacterium]
MSDPSTFSVADRPVGRGHPTLVVAEVAQGYDGSLGIAHAMIDLVADAGAECIKFQTHFADAESSPDEPWRVPFSSQDQSRFDYWKRMEFTDQQWQGLKQHADQRGLIFLSSPFSLRAVELLERLEVPAWKIASGEVNNPLLIEPVARTGIPVLLSTGLCSDEELDQVVTFLRRKRVPIGIFQCTTAYPCPPERIDLQRMGHFAQHYACPVGLSDHSGTIYAGLAAAALGADMIEVHVTMSRQMFGPDVAASVTGDELRQLVAGCRFVQQVVRPVIDLAADRRAEEQRQTLRSMFGKSLVARCALPRGTVLTKEDLDARKPGSGIRASAYRDVIGKRLVRDVAAGERLAESDLATADSGCGGVRRVS